MSDNEIREILRERKRAMRRHERLHEAKEIVEDIVGWASLFFIVFMLSVIFG